VEVQGDPKLKNLELPPDGLEDMAGLAHLHEPATLAFIVFASQHKEAGQPADTERASAERASVAETILATNALLEATGNAKTLRNDNSSRFGKLLLLTVDPDNGSIADGRIQTYMLEQPRVTTQAKHLLPSVVCTTN
jgi:hypothetical protein